MRKLRVKFALLAFAAIAGVFSYFYTRSFMESRAYLSAADSCAGHPTSHCLGQLAAMRLPDYGLIGANSDIGLSFRQLGLHAIAEERMKGDSVAIGEDASIRLYQLLRNDADAFARETLDDRPYVYARIWRWLDDDYPHRRYVSKEVRAAESAAHARRATDKPTPAHRALYARWRESLEQHESSGLDWLRFADASLELGDSDAAEHALDRARSQAAEVYGIARLAFALTGPATALGEILALEDPFERTGALIRLVGVAMRAQDTESAARFLKLFEEEYAAYAPPGGPGLPNSLDRSGDRWLIVVAEYWRDLGDEAEARRWALMYADSFEKPQSYAAAKAYLRIGDPAHAVAAAWTMHERIEPIAPYSELTTWQQLRAAQPYLEVTDVLRHAGAFEEALEVALQGLQQAPAPGQRLVGVMNSWDSTSYHDAVESAVITLMCETNRFDSAFSMAQSNERAAFTARARCRSALEENGQRLSLSEFGQRMGLYSNRYDEIEAAARLVRQGQYADAAAAIRASLTSPPFTRESSPAPANLDYLRLAVAMRDELLTQDVARQVVADTQQAGDIDAIHALQEAAISMLACETGG